MATRRRPERQGLHGPEQRVGCALQFIPQIATSAGRLTVFQRSPNWVLPKMDRPYRTWEQWLSEKLPVVTKIYRLRLWLLGELVLFPLMRGNRLMAAWARWRARRYIASRIADPALREKLLPDYPVGAKRILFSDNYFDALARANVEVVTTPIAGLCESGVICTDGSEVPEKAASCSPTPGARAPTPISASPPADFPICL